jgi:hypothetical protein
MAAKRPISLEADRHRHSAKRKSLMNATVAYHAPIPRDIPYRSTAVLLTFLVLFAVKSNGVRGIDENSFSGGSRDGRERAVCFWSRPPAAPEGQGG